MEDCIFCKIVKGEIPCHKVWEDENYLAFLDINPVNEGHVLLIPKKHHKNLEETPEEVVGEIFKKIPLLMKAIKKATNADYVAISVIGVDVPHLHIHLIPRYFNDGMTSFWPTKKYDSGKDVEVGNKIKEELK
jgi:histidine triad (HIT) family protein